MSYIQKVLLPDEVVLCVSHVHWIIYTEGMLITIAGGLLGFFCPSILHHIFGNATAQYLTRPVAGFAFVIVLFGAVLIAGSYIRQTATELVVTNRRVIAKYGLISRETFEIMVNRITGANFDQTIVGRLAGYGTVMVHGAGGDISPFDEIADPQSFHKALMNVLEHERAGRL